METGIVLANPVHQGGVGRPLTSLHFNLQAIGGTGENKMCTGGDSQYNILLGAQTRMKGYEFTWQKLTYYFEHATATYMKYH